ncbi:S-adenosyl-L-methionine-dependent methyltransferase [Thelonectria olida]|uniref:S-adenosyl-L-methionine-dependent methyltransferase n=1 Tax=Thelonectria olida TaxID=1576542 RepID=A0A9P9ALA2_9HYPO|nr:S-adenosyl-L-methionine-dependent methyltransferase [Thelonectria olida]
MTETNGTNGTHNGTSNGTNGTNGAVAANGIDQHKVDVSIALKANDAAAVPDLIKEITALGKGFNADDDQARIKLAMKARTLWKSLETPRETMIRHLWAEPSVMCALNGTFDKGLWTYLVQKDEVFTISEAAKAIKADPVLLGRLLRHLSSMGYLKEVGTDTYELTNFTRSMSIPIIGAGYPCVAGACVNALGKFSEWADLNDWKDPTDVYNAPLQLGYKTKLNFFEHLHNNPPWGEQFHLHMGGYRQGRPSWMDAGFFPVEDRLIKGFEATEDAAFLVDLGGSFGHDLTEFNTKFPDVSGRLILQDLPVVIDQIQTLDEKIEKMKYDFFTPQPIKGARAYYMHSVLHDWNEDTCLKILTTVMAAMKPGYSKLLINENVIPETGAQWEATALDVMMLTLLASRERTRDNWEVLLGKAGLKIVNVWTVANGVESLIECELPVEEAPVSELA